METRQMVLVMSAFSGLAGALLTQLMTGLFAYVNDRRKQKIALEEQFRSKKLEIGENFYFINGELMTMIRKTINHWNNYRNDRSEQTRKFMKGEMDKLNDYQIRLHNENWKFNLIGIYFKVPFSFDEIQLANRRTHQLYLQVIDLSNKIRDAAAAEREEHYGAYNLTIFDLCSQYEQTYKRMQDNMIAVRGELLAEFGQKVMS
jgi:hypothetical protein